MRIEYSEAAVGVNHNEVARGVFMDTGLDIVQMTEGCRHCRAGSKMVLFVTSRCHYNCDYCPLSLERRASSVMFANERECSTLDEVVEEARAMKATGAGITGGDPLLDLDATLAASLRLTKEFGPKHHIHLYTSVKVNREVATLLKSSGLDEIRFHLIDHSLETYLPSMKACDEVGLDVGVEIPCEPDHEEWLWELLEKLRGTPVKFLNLNELEITVGNEESMELRGFNLAGGKMAAVEGSAELATKLANRVNFAASKKADVEDGLVREPYGYHLLFCSSRYKDDGQLRRRFERRGESTLRKYESLTDDSTILFGFILSTPDDWEEDISQLKDEIGLSKGECKWVPEHNRIEMPVEAAEELANLIERPCGIAEIHPTHQRLEVGLVWLNELRP